MSKEILVLGATGKTGRRVAERLTNLRIPVRKGSRNADRPFDWENPNTWRAALSGVEKVYVTFQPDLAVPSAPDAITRFVLEARNAGVKKLVLLSGRGEKECEVCEEIVKGSGMDWTIVRASWFMQNFSESFLLDSVLAGQMVLPKLKAKEPFVDADDIADVMVAALVNDAHSKKTFSLTGPGLLSFEEATALIAAATNRPIQYAAVSMDEYTSMLRSYQIPEDFIAMIQYLFAEVLDGRNEFVTDDIEFVLKRKATSFADYIKKTIISGAWNKQLITL